MASQTVQAGKTSVSIPTGLFIDGAFRKAQKGQTFAVENPATGKTIIEVQEGLAEDVDDAVRTLVKSSGPKNGPNTVPRTGPNV